MTSSRMRAKSSVREQPGEVHQDTGRGTPDAAALVGQHVVVAALAGALVAFAPVVEGIHDEAHRQLESVGHLERIERQLYRRLDPADDRVDAKAGDGVVVA